MDVAVLDILGDRDGGPDNRPPTSILDDVEESSEESDDSDDDEDVQVVDASAAPKMEPNRPSGAPPAGSGGTASKSGATANAGDAAKTSAKTKSHKTDKKATPLKTAKGKKTKAQAEAGLDNALKKAKLKDSPQRRQFLKNWRRSGLRRPEPSNRWPTLLRRAGRMLGATEVLRVRATLRLRRWPPAEFRRPRAGCCGKHVG